MEILELTDVLTAVRAATVDVLAEQVERVTAAAKEYDLRILPSRLESNSLVLIDSSVAADEVVAIAVASEARLLYLRRVVLGHGTVKKLLEEVKGAERGRASKTLARVIGWTGRIEVGFACHGVLHLWETSVPWHDDLDELTSSPDGLSRWNPEPHDRGDHWEKTIAELAGQVAASQEFRRARWAEREAVAEKLPALAALKADPKAPRWTVPSVIRAADDLLRLQADTCATALEGRKGELAAALAADPGFIEIRTADARLRFTRTWIRHYSDGLAIADWLLKELIKLASELQRGTKPLQLSL